MAKNGKTPRDNLRNKLRDATPRTRSFYGAARRVGSPATYVRRKGTARELRSQDRYPLARDRGFRTLAPGEGPDPSPILSATDDVVAHGDRSAGGTKDFLRTGLLDTDRLSPDSPYLRFALAPELLATVSSYLGVVPVLNSIGVWRTVYVDRDPRRSQLHHCDGADVSQVKVFVYCTDVTADTGPLTVIDAATSERLRRDLGYRFGDHLTDEDVLAAGAQDSEHALLGKRGTVSMVDTSRCFHYGSRLGQGAPERIVAVFQYLTPFAFALPGRPRRTARFRHLASADSSPLERLALGAA